MINMMMIIIIIRRRRRRRIRGAEITTSRAKRMSPWKKRLQGSFNDIKGNI
jgi:hypothetical protein